MFFFPIEEKKKKKILKQLGDELPEEIEEKLLKQVEEKLLKEAKLEKQKEIVSKMLEKDLPLETISEISGLSIKEIEEFKV